MHIKIGNKQFTFYVSTLEKRTGVCSKHFDSDRHCLLWDFDEADIDSIRSGLHQLQKEFLLPSIYIVESSPFKYHAYCFASRSFCEVMAILALTPEIDVDYLRIGATRGYYTLRITPRQFDKFKLVATLHSDIPDEMHKLGMTVNEYFTSNLGSKQNE